MIDLKPSYLISRHLTIIEGKEKVKIFLEESISYAHRIDELVREGIGRKMNNLREIAEYVCKNLEATLTPQGLSTINAQLKKEDML